MKGVLRCRCPICGNEFYERYFAPSVTEQTISSFTSFMEKDRDGKFIVSCRDKTCQNAYLQLLGIYL